MVITLRHESPLEMYKNWIRAINPILKLRGDIEIPILASFVLLYDTHREKGYPVDALNNLLFSQDTFLSIRNKLGISERSFNKAFRVLQEKELVKNNTLNELVIPINGFTVNYEFRPTVVNDVQSGV